MYLLQLSHPGYMYNYDILKSVLIALGLAAPAAHAAAVVDTPDMSQLVASTSSTVPLQSPAAVTTPSLQTQPALVAAALAAPPLPPPTPKTARRTPQIDLRLVVVMRARVCVHV